MDLETLRHSASHIMADAVKKLYPKARLGIGPAIADGFYYDFDIEEAIAPEDLAKIENEMEKIIKEDLKFTQEKMSKEKAKEFFKKQGETYKLELIDRIEGDEVQATL